MLHLLVLLQVDGPLAFDQLEGDGVVGGEAQDDHIEARGVDELMRAAVQRGRQDLVIQDHEVRVVQTGVQGQVAALDLETDFVSERGVNSLDAVAFGLGVDGGRLELSAREALQERALPDARLADH